MDAAHIDGDRRGWMLAALMSLQRVDEEYPGLYPRVQEWLMLEQRAVDNEAQEMEFRTYADRATRVYGFPEGSVRADPSTWTVKYGNTLLHLASSEGQAGPQ